MALIWLLITVLEGTNMYKIVQLYLQEKYFVFTIYFMFDLSG